MSQDLFAAFGDSPPEPSASTALPGGFAPTRSSFQAPTRKSPPAPVIPTPAVIADDDGDDDDDDFGDFEDASKDESRDIADILKDRMGSPVMDKRPSYFDDELAKAAEAATIESTLPSSRSPYRPEKSPNLPPSQPPPKSLPFSPRPAANASASSSLPFKPKQESSKAPATGSHPFAGNMDLLFAAGDDDDYDAGADDLNVDLANDPEAAMAYSKQLIAAQAAAQERAPPPPPTKTTSVKAEEPKRQPNKLRKKSQYAPTNNTDVPFDVDDPANNEPELDDWGDFEGDGAAALPQQTISKAAPQNTKKNEVASNLDLLGLDDPPIQPTHSSSNGLHSAAKQRLAPSTKARPLQGPPPAEDDDWDDFESSAPASSTTRPSNPTPTLPTSTSNLASKPKASLESSLPPTNIPPPLILLSIFPSLISEAQSTLFDTLARIPTEQKHEFLAHEATQQYLRNYIALATVLAHIIAGRKLRWKRDQFLAQGMRIGPASTGGRGGGMKLTGLDKTEAAKEDREVLDLVRLWRAQAGKLRSAVTSANSLPSSSAKLPAVPEIGEQMPVRLLKAGLTAAHACALCGLKREERVARVDEEVEDSFGEWWVEGMNMHTNCCSFWEEYQGKLRSR